MHAVVAALLIFVSPIPPQLWVRPVDGEIVRKFEAPKSVYGRGHRGVDFAAPTGTPVRAAGAGTVSFAGRVGGTLHVTVAHEQHLRTSYSFLATIGVHQGQRVTRAEVIGSAGGAAPADEQGRLHFSLRVGDEYVDPMGLFQPVDLAKVVHLSPTDERRGTPSVVTERQALERALHLGPQRLPDPLIWLGDRPSGGRDLVTAVSDAATRVGEQALRTLGAALSKSPLGVALADFSAIARRASAWQRSLARCTKKPPALRSTGGSGHLLMAVGGINSTGTPEHAFDLPWRKLGYLRDEVQFFSYAPDGGAYAKTDTWNDLLVSAGRLDAQLRALGGSAPGREIDLIAHSQGGAIVRVFLQLFYDPTDPAYPPLGTVVTLSSPLNGAPLATASNEIARSRTGRAVLDALQHRAGLPPADARSVQQLDERSPLLRRLQRLPWPDQLDFTSIGAVDDVIVPATVTQLASATEVMVDPAGFSDHHGVATSGESMGAVKLALEGKPAPCVGWLAGLRGAVEPVLITRFEHTAGHVGAGLARLAG